ncbi:glutathione S-transferase family protein [Celeribacter indicus]|uniref:Glutathione S-transferase n=1 Tax=Celeribacter indicus TaxID=1208324 RepID=A0A0B5DYR5_9RHOB|nr:glutathione S-transferase [Celeribacter indicus]AJE45861.1 glutathione S-transferase [Celeribacter indicus]SDW62465.1 glutathione S-transferase [Celeribacter indicus]
MKLYHSPGTCSEGILVLLEEIGADYDLVITDLKQAAHREPEYLRVNPKGKVPALSLGDGSVLTEFPVIAFWLARRHPEAGLLPEGLEAEIRVMELTEYIVSTLHMRGSVFAMKPQKFTADPAAREELRAQGRAVVAAGYERLTEQLGEKPCLFGSFSIADAAAFYLLSWKEGIGVPVPPALAAYEERLRARAAFGRAREASDRAAA